ncbi:LamG-like jellyroll fold domain-containing protein [Lutibacter sp. TH_r2]|uniref:LamG-like jellyroll fold domain-containing protein n=1 Tax=Lutibacter sp. TH_r2 TaxID=3082083 RepID=UPI00295338CD|nr:LamG-like jellyroll fold domain-containing protein [Lutibacter sp. TH_r2]MDV7185700.1 LamG-like jellyroll fold domain-containing protein [Lutibacter sp. TH_r2]
MKTKLLIVFALTSCICFSQTGLDFTSSSPATFVKGLDNASLDLTQGTIEAWIKTADAGTTYRGILVKQAAYGMFLYDNELIAYDWGSNTEKESNVILNDDQWHHVAITFDDNVTNGSQFYVDGQPVLSFTYNVQTSNTLIVVGKGNDTEADIGQQFNGQIDNVRVWNTIRTNTEILGTFNKCLTGNENGLVLNWKFEEGSGTSTADDSGNGNTGTLYNMDNTNWVSGYSCYPIELVAYYPFNGNANDESGNENHGTVNGATLTTDRFGNTDNAYSFDGIDNFIQVPNSNSLDISNSDLTISMWLYNDNPLTDSSWKGISKGGYDTHTGYELIFTNNPSNSNGKLGFNIGSSGYNVSSFNTYSDQWIMLTGTYENGVRKVYINGIEQTTTPQGGDTLDSSTSDLYIGKRAPLNNFIGFVKGKMDDIRIFNKALTASEILNFYTNNSLNVEKKTSTTKSIFFIHKNTLHFKSIQNLNDIKSIEVYNLLGQKVFKTSKIEEEIKLENLRIGIYIAKVNTENGYQTLKFINR